MISEFLSFEKNPEFVAAFRFMFWSLFLGLSMIAWRYYIRACKHVSEGGELIFPASRPFCVAVVYSCISAHQFYYWMTHRARGYNDEALLSALADIRHITSLLLIIMCVAGLWYARLFLSDILGRYWALGGALFMMLLWGIGYGDANTWL